MKKMTLVSAAALGCMATAAMAQETPAASSVTLYGIADVGFNHVTGLKQGSVTQLASGIMEGSRWGLKGNEELGGGYKAIFTLESRVELDTGSVSNRPASGSQVPDRLNTATLMGLPAVFQPAVTAVAGSLGAQLGVNHIDKNLFDRQAYVGLITPVGAITAGRQYTPGYLASATFDSMHTESSLALGQLVSVPVSFTIRTSNALQYAIQTNGITATVMYAMGEVAGNNSANRLLGTMVVYKGAGFSVGGGYNTQNNEVGQKSLTNGILGASVDIGPGTLSTMFATIKDDNPAGVSGIAALVGGGAGVLVQNAFTTALKQNATLAHIGYRMTMGANTVTVAYNTMNDKTASNADRDSYGVAYSYALSKRTDLNAVLTRFNNKNSSQLAPGGNGFLGGVTATAGTDSTNVAFGIRHRF
ncbi:porin [Rhodoferax sp.]|uniref:porin n=1 Tax=Rhodoferax sp. TaxID=50421 RepID=UPI0025E9D495|nr:porin [Rhodoferax sp.]